MEQVKGTLVGDHSGVSILVMLVCFMICMRRFASKAIMTC